MSHSKKISYTRNCRQSNKPPRPSILLPPADLAKSIEKIRVLVHCNEKGWKDQEACKQWVRHIWQRRTDGGLRREKSLLVWDRFSANLMAEVTENVMNQGFKGMERVSATSVGNQNNVSSRVPLITSGLVNLSIPSTAERIKPPPTCINTARKTIKLGGGSSTSPSSSSLNILDRKTIKLSSSSISLSSVNTPVRKIVKLSDSPSKTSSLDKIAQSGSQRTPTRPEPVYGQHLSRSNPVHRQLSSQPDSAYGQHCDRVRAASSKERVTSSHDHRTGERLDIQEHGDGHRNRLDIGSKSEGQDHTRSYKKHKKLSESNERKKERKRPRESSESDMSSDEEMRAKRWKNLQKTMKKKKKKHKHSENEKETNVLDEESERRKKKKSKKKRKHSNEGGYISPEVVVIKSDSESERKKKKKSKKKKKKRSHSHSRSDHA
ncbi:unnamed protein product, partial [Meganyctiphanes norvegica]